MEYILIGKMVKTFGLKGEMKTEVYTDFVKERFAKGSTVYFSKGEEYLPFVVKRYRDHNGSLLLTFEGHEDINLIEKYKGYSLYKADTDIKPLKKGEYYFRDLKDLEVYDGERHLGKVLQVEEGLRHNFLRVMTEDKKTALIPFTEVFIKEVNLEEKRIDIHYIEGLL